MAGQRLSYQELEAQYSALQKQYELLQLQAKAEHHHKFLFQNSPDGFAYHKMIFENDRPVDYIFIEVNKAFEQTTGLLNVKGRRVTEVIPDIKETNADLLNVYGAVASTGIPQKFEVYFGPLESWFSVSAICPEPGYFITIFDDITERKKVEKVLQDSEREYRTTVDSLLVGVVVHGRDTQILFSNKEANSILGLTEEQMAGKVAMDPAWMFVYEDFTRMKIEDYPVSKVVATNSPLKNYVFGIVRPDRGYVTWVNVNAMPLFYDDNSLEKVLINFVDITESKQYELALKERENQLGKLNATKDKLFSIIAHDLRSPFCSIIGISDMLISNIARFDVVESTKFLSYINTTSKHTLALLDNLLDWAKLQTGQLGYRPETLNLASIISGVIELLEPNAKMKDIALFGSSEDHLRIQADKNMLQVVLRNLISNAIKFTNKGGKVGVFAVMDRGQLVLTVADNGVGMDDAMKNALFSKYVNTTTKGTANEKGSGIGLMLCKELIEKHGGEIWIESELGVGSEFKFTLPLNLQ